MITIQSNKNKQTENEHLFKSVFQKQTRELINLFKSLSKRTSILIYTRPETKMEFVAKNSFTHGAADEVGNLPHVCYLSNYGCKGGMCDPKVSEKGKSRAQLRTMSAAVKQARKARVDRKQSIMIADLFELDYGRSTPADSVIEDQLEENMTANIWDVSEIRQEIKKSMNCNKYVRVIKAPRETPIEVVGNRSKRVSKSNFKPLNGVEVELITPTWVSSLGPIYFGTSVDLEKFETSVDVVRSCERSTVKEYEIMSNNLINHSTGPATPFGVNGISAEASVNRLMPAFMQSVKPIARVVEESRSIEIEPLLMSSSKSEDTLREVKRANSLESVVEEVEVENQEGFTVVVRKNLPKAKPKMVKRAASAPLIKRADKVKPVVAEKPVFFKAGFVADRKHWLRLNDPTEVQYKLQWERHMERTKVVDSRSYGMVAKIGGIPSTGVVSTSPTKIKRVLRLSKARLDFCRAQQSSHPRVHASEVFDYKCFGETRPSFASIPGGILQDMAFFWPEWYENPNIYIRGGNTENFALIDEFDKREKMGERKYGYRCAANKMYGILGPGYLLPCTGYLADMFTDEIDSLLSKDEMTWVGPAYELAQPSTSKGTGKRISGRVVTKLRSPIAVQAGDVASKIAFNAKSLEVVAQCETTEVVQTKAQSEKLAKIAELEAILLSVMAQLKKLKDV